jgi:hypothetical protein
MSLNFENIGKMLAMVRTKKKIKGVPIISVDSKHDAHHHFQEYHLKNDDSFLPIPDPESERSIIYITGKSGSGKSFYCKEWIKEYKKLYPNNPIYLFSSLESDPTIDEIKDIQRVKLTPEFLKEDFTSEDFKNALVIADDTDCLIDKKMLKAVNKILDSILVVGRHSHTSLLITSHLSCNGAATKMILNESHNIVFFPSGMGNRNLKYLLDNYLGLDKKQIETVKNLNTRWCCISRSYPSVIISEKDIYLVKAIK